MKDSSLDLNKSRSGNKNVAALTHILGFLTGVLGPALVYILSDDEFVKENAARSITWQIFFTIYLFASFFMAIFFLGLIFIPIIAIADLVFSIIATVKASNGTAWKYPLTTDLIVQNDQKSDRKDIRETSQDKNINKPDGRIDELKQMYLNGEISEEEVENLVDLNLDKTRAENETRDLEREIN